MDIGIGLPSTIEGTEGDRIVDWAVAAERAGFTSLSTLDRIVFPNYEPLVALSAAAAVTKRVRLVTTVLLAPLRINAVLLAKQAASLDRLSKGRFVFGTGLGGREDDYETSHVPMQGRGHVHDRILEEMKRVWSGADYGLAGGVGPSPYREGGPVMVLGGHTPPVYRRAARYADGWVGGVGPPERFPAMAAELDAAWEKEGREGKPLKLAMAFFAAGPNATTLARNYVNHYSGYLGPEWVDRIAAAVVTTQTMIEEYIASYISFGCDELMFVPCSNELDQVELLADQAGLA